MTMSQSNIGLPDGDLSDSGKLGQKGDFDRRQKKKWVYGILKILFFFFRCVMLDFLAFFNHH